MKVWVYVEGKSDVGALSALWIGWTQELGKNGWGIRIIPLENKSEYFKKIGPRATEKLLNDSNDLVVGLPDLYPNRDYASTNYKHNDLRELQGVQKSLVNESLRSQQKARQTDIDSYRTRFYASALKHDLEVLLLAATGQLQSLLNINNRPWRQPPEDQNQNKPPKKIVEELFRRHLKRAYREISDSAAILRDADLRKVAEQCPAFRAMIDWIGEKTGVPGY